MYPQNEDLASLLPTEVGQESRFHINGKPYTAVFTDGKTCIIQGFDRRIDMEYEAGAWDVHMRRGAEVWTGQDRPLAFIQHSLLAT